MINDAGDGRDDEEDMSKECDAYRNANRLEPAPVGIGNIGTEERDKVNPETCHTSVSSQGMNGTHQNELNVVSPSNNWREREVRF